MNDRSQRSLIPWIFVGGMLLVVVVNAGLVAAALSSYSGLAHADAFGRGIAYNRLLAGVERQERLGWNWRVTLDVAAEARGTLQVVLADAGGLPLTGARIEAVLQRPVERLAPIAVALREVGTGVYAAEVDLPRRGQWDVKLAIARAGDSVAAINRVFAR